MMGLEPTTFCMASRRSSQLSYIRTRPQYSPVFVLPSGANGPPGPVLLPPSLDSSDTRESVMRERGCGAGAHRAFGIVILTRSVELYGKPIHFAGVMTQHKARCGCGYRPKEAHRALVFALREHPKTCVRRLPALANIKWD